ncbi:MAG: hypothetical protein Q7J47_22920 [Azoarcus sp.]|nr:hypothetical protein [Azoarcus sp.]
MSLALLLWAAGPMTASAQTLPPTSSAAALNPHGIASFTLGRQLKSAAAGALRLDPAAALIGPGCDERDQVTVNLNVSGHAMTVMAMATADGHIEEIIALPHGLAVSLPDAAACRASGVSFARSLSGTLGPFSDADPVMKAVSEEFAFVFPQRARAVARWFAGGRTCDLALQFGSKSGP